MDSATRQRVHDAIVRLADGDRGGFSAIFADLWPIVLGIAIRSLGNRADAEDAAQQALVNVCFRVAEFDRTRDGFGWALGVAAWEVRTHLRRRWRRRESPAVDAGQPSGSPTPEQHVIDAELTAAVSQLVARLTPAERIAVLREYGDAAATAAERKRRQRAIERLRRWWRARYD